MSRFEDVTPTRSNPDPQFSLNTESHFNKRAVVEVLGDAESITPVYDADRDELAFRTYEGSGGIRSLIDHGPGKSVSMREILQSPQIDIDPDRIESGIPLPLLYDGEEGLPYVRLGPAREAIVDGEQSSQRPPTGEDHPRGETV